MFLYHQTSFLLNLIYTNISKSMKNITFYSFLKNQNERRNLFVCRTLIIFIIINIPYSVIKRKNSYMKWKIFKRNYFICISLYIFIIIRSI